MRISHKVTTLALKRGKQDVAETGSESDIKSFDIIIVNRNGKLHKVGVAAIACYHYVWTINKHTIISN